MYKYKKTDEQTLRNMFEIALLSENYLKSKRIICEYEDCIINLSSDRLEMHRKIVHHIEYAAESLNDKERLIIENEVLRGRKGKWFKGFMSAPSYYRHRQSAYENFLHCL